jgi:hypothetical protein
MTKGRSAMSYRSSNLRAPESEIEDIPKLRIGLVICGLYYI